MALPTSAMAALQLIAVDGVAATPWRNGGGVTRELLAWPSAQAWQLRISVANIDADGPFSDFPGVDRWFAVVQGHGVALRFADQTLQLNAQSAPAQFEAERTPHCSLTDGATRDLNLMSRRDAGSARMLRAVAGEVWQSSAPFRALFCSAPVRLQVDGADAGNLPAWTLAFSADARHQRWCAWPLGETLQAWWMEFSPLPPI